MKKGMSITELSQIQWEWVESRDWHNKVTLEYLALIASEVGEAVNECRGEKPTDEFGTELADIVLRVFDMAVQYDIDIERAILDKMEKNFNSQKPNGKIK